jgi:hypothetical protein
MVTPRRRSIVFALAAMAGWALAGCGGTGCLLNAVAGLHVTILDGPGGAPLCGVTVTATDGAYSAVLAESPGGAPCYYYGASERPGVYTIEATFEGRTATMSNVRVTEGTCHVTPADVSIVLPAAVAFDVNDIGP